MKTLLITVCTFYCVSCSEENSQATVANQSTSIHVPKTALEVISDSSPNVPPEGWEKTGSCTGFARLAADHSEKFNRCSVLIGETAYLFRGDYLNFDDQDLGKTIMVTGDLKIGRLPMFIQQPEQQGFVPSGMGMPPGTDIEKESRYYYFDNPKWTIID